MTNLIILGTSARAAAMSALRAGWTPWCVDLFADADLERLARVRRIPGRIYPDGLIDALKDAPPGPVLYTGALENRPDLIAKIDRPLWGNPPEVLRAVRDPALWTQALRDAGLPCPAISFQPHAGRWLVKPRKSGGGIGITPFGGAAIPRGAFLQEWLDGESVSAVFVGNSDGVTLIGVTRQLVGSAWLNASGFHYAGNIGPSDDGAADHWRRIGNVLVQCFGLRGLFGVDAILLDGVPWPVEVNPRYTASVEVFERALGTALLRSHRACFGQEKPKGEVLRTPGIPVARCTLPLGFPRVIGKAILYARQTFAFPGEALLDGVECADIPHVGQVIQPKQPVLTMFANGASVAECEANLQEKTRTLDRWLWG